MTIADDPVPHAPRRAPLIPPDPRRDAPLFFVVAILAFLACLAGLASHAAWRATDEWTSALDASATVQVLATDEESADVAAARAADVLKAMEGVESADALPREEAEALLAPWFGTSLPDELPAPRLIAVTLARDAPASPDAMRAALAEAGLETELDDHQRWEADIARAAGAAQGLSLAVVALLAGAAGAVAVFATQAGLAAKREVVDALRVAGAADRLVAFVFLRRFFFVGLGAGAGGAALAAIALAAIYFLFEGQADMLSLPTPGWAELWVLLAAPAATSVLGAVTAWITVIAELGRNA